MIDKEKVNSTPMKRRPPCLIRVIKTQRISNRIQRVSFQSDDLWDFPKNCGGAHIKLFFPRTHQDAPILPQLTDKGIRWPDLKDKPITRTYSVRTFDPIAHTLEVDFVAHSDNAPASGWAIRAQPGDCIGLAGPGGPAPLVAPAQWTLFTGDLSAAPAISALVESMPIQHYGQIFLEIDNASERIPMPSHPNIILNWVIRCTHTSLLEHVQACAIPNNLSRSAFVAGESGTVVNIRDYLITRYQFTKANLYAVPYWRRGQNEEQYHADRHKVMDEVY